MARRKTIYCPKCGERVGSYDGKSTINVILKCKKCNKQVIYCIDTREIKVKPIPPRTTSSGMTF